MGTRAYAAGRPGRRSKYRSVKYVRDVRDASGESRMDGQCVIR
jgi:hypothetical protein